MKANERRKEIITILTTDGVAVPGGELAARLDVSRQAIVQDIAVLKAAGYEILSTHQGYLLKQTPHKERVFKVYHTSEQTQDELSCIVENGGTVLNVFVWHKVYGRLEAKLNIFSARDVESFMNGIQSGKSTELMHITAGYHYHTVLAESEEVLDKISDELNKRGYLVTEA